MEDVFARLDASGLPAWESGLTALDAWRGNPAAPLRFLAVEASLVDLAKTFEALEYPGLPYADVAIRGDTGGPSWLLRTVEGPGGLERGPFAPLDFLRDPRRKVFLDPRDVYGSLREKLLSPRDAAPEDALFFGAVLLARHPWELPSDFAPRAPEGLSAAWQRDLLALILTAPTPERALDFLRRCGFVEDYWPELSELGAVDHSKEHHPEGDAWRHTLETFRYRKIPDFRLSLALLLHDTGKPRATASEGRRFDGHAEIGRGVAERFLRRLGYPAELVADVSWFVRNHMLPAALPSLPLYRAREVVEDGRFPILLELYKCDELSSFKGPDRYYEACAAYRAFLRNSRNPYRSAEGKKLQRMWLEVDQPARH